MGKSSILGRFPRGSQHNPRPALPIGIFTTGAGLSEASTAPIGEFTISARQSNKTLLRRQQPRLEGVLELTLRQLRSRVASTMTHSGVLEDSVPQGHLTALTIIHPPPRRWAIGLSSLPVPFVHSVTTGFD